MDGDRVDVRVDWTGGSHRFAASLVDGEARMERALSRAAFRGTAQVRLSGEDLRELRELAAEVQASEQDLVDYDFWEFGGERVEVRRAQAHVVVSVERGHIREGGAYRRMEWVAALVDRHLPWPTSDG